MVWPFWNSQHSSGSVQSFIIPLVNFVNPTCSWIVLIKVIFSWHFALFTHLLRYAICPEHRHRQTQTTKICSFNILEAESEKKAVKCWISLHLLEKKTIVRCSWQINWYNLLCCHFLGIFSVVQELNLKPQTKYLFLSEVSGKTLISKYLRTIEHLNSPPPPKKNKENWDL